jgi:hypothetical protein
MIYFVSFAVRNLRQTDLSHRPLCTFAAVRHGRTTSSSTVSPSGDVLQKFGSAQLLRLLPRSSKGVSGVLQYAWRATEHQGHGSMYPLQNYGRTTFNHVKCNILFEHMRGPKFEVRLFLVTRRTAARILSWTGWNKWKAMCVSGLTTSRLGLPIGNVWCVFCIVFLCHSIIVQYLLAIGSLNPWFVSWVLRSFA